MEQYPIEFDPGRQMDLEERQDRCQKALKVIVKAIVMRLVVFAILILAVIRSGMPVWAAGLMVLVMVINLTGLLPLVSELKKRRREWKMLLEEEER